MAVSLQSALVEFGDAVRPLLDANFSLDPPLVATLDFGARLYAGSAVLSAFYGDEGWAPGDVDVFVSTARPPPGGLSALLARIRPEPGFEVVCGSDYGGAFTVFRVLEVATQRRALDVVVLFAGAGLTELKLHAAMVKRFDIKICALAWTGTKLLYPPKGLADLGKKWSQVVVHEGREDEAHARIRKYLGRGFAIEDEQGQKFEQPLLLGGVEVRHARKE